MKGYRVEAFDDYIRLQEGANDHHMRAILRFRERLDEAALRASLRRCLDAIPIAACAFDGRGARSRWRERSAAFADHELLSLKKEEPSEEVLLAAIAERTEPLRGPQARAVLLRGKAEDYLILIANHMAFDGSGMKEFLYRVAAGYAPGAARAENGAESAEGERSPWALLEQISLGEKAASLRRRGAGADGSGTCLVEDGQEPRPHLHRAIIEEENFDKARVYAAARGATVNDFMMALFARGLAASGGYRRGSGIGISFMVDMRRYDAERRMSPFCNLSSMERLRMPDPLGAFEEILAAASSGSRAIKEGSPGLKNFLSLALARALMPRPLFDAAVRKLVKGLGASTSNLGILEEEKLSFSGIRPAEAWLATSLKRQPGIQLSFSTYRGRLTMNALSLCSEGNARRVDRAFAEMERTLREILG